MKKMPNQRHVSKFAELDGGGVFSGEKKFYKDANQTENFTGAKTENGGWKTLLTQKKIRYVNNTHFQNVPCIVKQMEYIYTDIFGWNSSKKYIKEWHT